MNEIENKQEILTLAAKAIGMELTVAGFVNGVPIMWTPERKAWDPLENDGDAFRLAMDLQFDIEMSYESRVTISYFDDNIDLHMGEMEYNGRDKMTVARMAIVAAAAKYGNMIKTPKEPAPLPPDPTLSLQDAIDEARAEHGQKWPADLTSGIMFWKGHRITIEDFEAGKI
jgi:hypothetical protein